MLEPLHVDLSAAPESRWTLPTEHATAVRELLDAFVHELGDPATLEGAVAEAAPHLPDELKAEIESVARQLDVPFAKAAAGTLYYDALKLVLGCSTFVLESEAGVLHARNLDWPGPDRVLQRHTVTTHFTGGTAGDFTTVGWPGFLGAMSGVAPGRFSITLNAVASDEPAQLATPVVWVLRDVLATASDFDEAVDRLAGAQIPCDCLLTIAGAIPGEACVIERTPTRYGFRGSENGVLIATNDYRDLDVGVADPEQLLAATACGRFDRLTETLHVAMSLEDAFAALSDPAVQMEITVQQMVFRASDGLCEVRTT